MSSRAVYPKGIHDIPWRWLREEKWRRHTFLKGGYPDEAFKSAAELASHGFAYCGSGDRNSDSVICCFCGATKQGWRRSDVILDVHNEICPQCCMVTGIDCDNITLLQYSAAAGDEASGTSVSEAMATQMPGAQWDPKDDTSTPPVGIMARGQWHERTIGDSGMIRMSWSALKENRLRTFQMPSREESMRDNPASMSDEELREAREEAQRLDSLDKQLTTLYINREDLAEAGYCFMGFGQMGAIVHCFCCGGGLRWTFDCRSAWIEHARWCPDCAFLRLKMGFPFIQAVDRLKTDFSIITMANVSARMGDSARKLNDVSVNPIRNGNLCSLCCCKERAVVFLPCGHLTACKDCAFLGLKCCLCERNITYILPISQLP